VFDQMRESAQFAAGKQWPAQSANDDRYRANITLRHINQRVASLYAKNPKVRALCKPKIYFQTWDGSAEMLRAARNAVMAVEQPDAYQAAMTTGQVEPASMDLTTAQLVVQEAQEIDQQKRMYRTLAQTLEIVGAVRSTSRSAEIQDAGEAARAPRADVQGRLREARLPAADDAHAGHGGAIKDITDKLEQIQRLTADLADGEIHEDSAEAEELRQSLKTLQEKKEIIVREGLTFSFPKAWSVIPDHENTQLKGFVGAEWIVEEYIFTPKKVQKIYSVDVGTNYNPHTPEGKRGDKRKKDDKFCAVYEVHDIVNQQVFTICSGYDGYLKAPANEDIELEQVHPYFALTFNDVESTGESATENIFPAVGRGTACADGCGLQPRARGAARASHRQPPGDCFRAGVFDDQDRRNKLATHADHENIELKISKSDDINKLIQPKPTVPIQKELYDVEHVFVDTQRVVGDQAANLGGTSGSTATETTIAENSRVTTHPIEHRRPGRIPHRR
jgi:hypothetical protein